MLALNVPVLNSLPSATKQLFIDFDGNAAFSWTNNNGTYSVHGAGPTS